MKIKNLKELDGIKIGEVEFKLLKSGEIYAKVRGMPLFVVANNNIQDLLDAFPEIEFEEDKPEKVSFSEAVKFIREKYKTNVVRATVIDNEVTFTAVVEIGGNYYQNIDLRDKLPFIVEA